MSIILHLKVSKFIPLHIIQINLGLDWTFWDTVVFEYIICLYTLALSILERWKPAPCGNLLDAFHNWPLQFGDACASYNLLMIELVWFLMQRLLHLYATLATSTNSFYWQLHEHPLESDKIFLFRKYQGSTSSVEKVGRSSHPHFPTIPSLQKVCGLHLIPCFKILHWWRANYLNSSLTQEFMGQSFLYILLEFIWYLYVLNQW